MFQKRHRIVWSRQLVYGYSGLAGVWRRKSKPKVRFSLRLENVTALHFERVRGNFELGSVAISLFFAWDRGGRLPDCGFEL
jgi:hypothetical protein